MAGWESPGRGRAGSNHSQSAHVCAIAIEPMLELSTLKRKMPSPPPVKLRYWKPCEGFIFCRLTLSHVFFGCLQTNTYIETEA
jgi:hypothetical protein